jgi:hypothetical protein
MYLELLTMRPELAARTARLSVYLSVLLGPFLLVQVFGLVPGFLFDSLLLGWLAYLGVALAMLRGLRISYYLSALLALLVLLVSLPEPAHYAFISEGKLLAAATFVIGDVLQVVVIISVLVFVLGEGGRSSGSGPTHAP